MIVLRLADAVPAAVPAHAAMPADADARPAAPLMLLLLVAIFDCARSDATSTLASSSAAAAMLPPGEIAAAQLQLSASDMPRLRRQADSLIHGVRAVAAPPCCVCGGVCACACVVVHRGVCVCVNSGRCSDTRAVCEWRAQRQRYTIRRRGFVSSMRG